MIACMDVVLGMGWNHQQDNQGRSLLDDFVEIDPKDPKSVQVEAICQRQLNDFENREVECFSRGSAFWS